MSLIVRVQVNNQGPLAQISVQRITNSSNSIADDAVNEYSWAISQMVEPKIRNGRVTHRYGDGALALLRKVCDEANL